MNAKNRIKKAINHEQTNKLPVDFGGNMLTDIAISTIYKLRQYYSLDDPKTPVKFSEPFYRY